MGGILSKGITISMAGTIIGEVTDFNGVDGSATVIDKTTLASEAKEKLLGLRDEGKFSFTINFDPANPSHAALNAARASGEAKTFEITAGGFGTHKMTFSAFVMSCPISGGVDALVGQNITLEITGPVTWPTVVSEG